MVKRKKEIILYALFILLASFFTLHSSFSLAFDGDSYLTLWRYLDTVEVQKIYTPFSYFFTDYGPQDSIFALLYKLFGLVPIYFYIVSFLLRYLASLSVFALTTYLSKNRFAGFLSGLLFSVSTAGLETTNWVFNMPSYLAISFLCLFFIIYFYQKKNSTITLQILLWILFIVTIVIQPIRMAFLPVLVIFLEITCFFFERTKTQLKSIATKIFIVLVISFILFAKGSIGNSIGIYGQQNERLSGNWMPQIQKYFSITSEESMSNHPESLLLPIAQIGKIIYPDTMFPERLVPNLQVRVVKVTIFFLFIFAIFLVLCRSALSKISVRSALFAVVSYTILSILIWDFFIRIPQYAIMGANYLAFLLGGMYITFTVLLFAHYKPQRLILFFPSILLIFSFLIPWIRSPLLLQETINRYLIVGSAAFAIFVGMLFTLISKNYYKFLNIGIILLIIVNIVASQKYLGNLAHVREYQTTERIRKSISDAIDFDKSNEPLIFYFESDNKELLYHSLLFGFPVIMAFEKGFWNWNGIAYTESWYEFEDAYKTGQSLKRFSIPPAPVPLDNMYSFKIKDTTVIDTTESMRERLIK
jgi:hypothetical protein